MSMALNTEGVNISRMRLRGGAKDPLLTRLRVSALLASASLAPPDISAAAILIVNKFKYPLPGNIALKGGAMRLSTEWEQAVRLRMSLLARTALRPIRSEVAGSADAVLFADEAELAACLVRDWLHGRVADRWWWRRVLGDLSPPQWLRQHVLARGEVMVPAIAVLAVRSLAAAWLARMEDAEAEEALLAIERTHALSPAMTQDQSSAQRPRVDNDHPGLAEGVTQADARTTAFERLITTVPEARAPALRPQQRRLLALSLALTRAPSWARTPQLAIALQELDHAGLAEGAHASLIPGTGRPWIHKLLVARTAAGVGMEKMSNPAKLHSGLQDMTGAAAPLRPEETQVRNPMQAGIARFETQDATQNTPSMVTQAFVHSGAAEKTEALSAVTTLGVPQDEAPAIEDSLRVHTRYGGIFYLLNAAIALELYSDFTAPVGKNLTLSPWDWLALVGRAWFGTEFVHDPVWKVLAQLAGRTVKDAPDRDFSAPSDWRIDPDWLAPWGVVDTLRVGVTRTRLRVLQGFAVFDVARDPAVRPLAQARALCAASDALRGHKLKRGRALQPHARARTATTRWLQWLLDYLRARLALALGSDGSDDVPALLCRHPAELAASASGVHVHLALAGLPLPIRFAGLDRDPGWIPAAGRAVHFHFA